ncbi:coiled-coil domain-containing protein 34 [Syngnathoides biaculeatus]|uniref:coiled-coil domain-containing protein 34 n=1 Tax=Syngnathoides biaculeatus TaxID=300417 RepID=UPI002ADD42C1|nr:coiled-coil domain-containing protein 34 [Syngnathoides biaculeatus]
MSGWWLPNPPAFASEDFSSSPLKLNERKHVHMSEYLVDDDVLPEDDDTYSLLSPIYHDSYESDEDDDLSTTQQPLKCELENPPSEQTEPEALSPWEVWLVNKAKEDQLKMKRKTEEALLLKEKKEQEEIERRQKKIMEEKKIRDWQQLKRDQERHDQLLKMSREAAEAQRRQEKQRETEQKAQQRYKDWLQKKNRERIEKEMKQKEEASLREEQEKDRRRKAEENFKEWLAKNNEKWKASPKPPHYSSPCRFHPPPSFYNPIPWKPIYTPPLETSPKNTPSKKPQKTRKGQHGRAFRITNLTQK